MTKISALSDIGTSVASNDTFVLVDVSDPTTPNKKIQQQNLFLIPDGSAGTPGLRFLSDTNVGLFRPTTDTLAIATGGSERLRIDSSGRLGLGTSSPSAGYLLDVRGSMYVVGTNSRVYVDNGGIGGSSVQIGVSGTSHGYIGTDGNFPLVFQPNNTERVRITSAGLVGIGSTAPNYELQINASDAVSVIQLTNTSTGATASDGLLIYNNGVNAFISNEESGFLKFQTAGAERAQIDASGRLLVGTSTSGSTGSAQYARLQVQGNTGGSTNGGMLALMRQQAATAPLNANDLMGLISFADSSGNEFATILCTADATTAAGDYPGRLTFSTTADGASSPTERARITQGGQLWVGTTTEFAVTDSSATGHRLTSTGEVVHVASAAPCMYVGRQTNDGTIISIRQAGAEEGTISVSGTTVSYNGAHLSRWSQLPGGAEREEILRGTVLSNIDEMCGWGEEDNEQLNRMKVSDVEGDPNVSGVFQAWDDDDDTYTDDFYCAMTGDFIIRIAEGVTVQRGDLLISAGDGTAKPQGDDIVRSKTIAKVTSTHVTCTYDDGSYCVPCVLMAC
jgi:hypothetical protein